MPRLAFVVNNLDFLVSHRLVLVREAVKAGFEVHALGPESPSREVLEGLGAQVHAWDLSRKGQNPLIEARSVAALARRYAQLRPDLVHHVTIKPVLYGSAAARLARVGAVVNAVSGLGYVFLSKGPVARARRAGVVAAYRLAFSGPNTAVVLQNDQDEATLQEMGALGRAEVVRVPGSGVDLEAFAPQPEADGVPVVVLPARLLADKGVREFVEAARRLKARQLPVRMVLVGGLDSGNPAAIEAGELDGWVREGAVEWWGHRADMPAVYAQAAIICLPSYREGMSKALLEAAAAGRAIVTTDAPGCREVVDGGRFGVLVPVRDGAALADGLAGLLTDAERRRNFARTGAEHARAHFGEDRVWAAHRALYGRLLERSKSPH